MCNVLRLFNTLKYLKAKQIYFRFFYLIRTKYRKSIKFEYDYFLASTSTSTSLKLDNSLESNCHCYQYEFRFLNLSKIFHGEIDWNYREYGKLWTYNLTYFEFLKETSDLNLIYDFIENIGKIKDGLEPYPTSLRGIHWIKYLSRFSIKDKKIDDSLYAQYYILMDNLEYHLLGNHLLENGFSLLFGAYYFHDEPLYKKAIEILEVELKEQILSDGGHFELSPMYHQIILYRLLDCINLVQNNNWKNKEYLVFLCKKASLMLGWLKTISYKDGNIPHLNDSTINIAPTSKELFEYAARLNIHEKKEPLKESGYWKFQNQSYECIVDVGRVGADYIPGHAHSDTFNFEIYYDEAPFIVDTGTTTYETNERRQVERSTLSHNTVELNDANQSDVWAGFRVANRATVHNITRGNGHLKATHNGYKKRFGVMHTREWFFEDKNIIIKDHLDKTANAKAYLHFHPNIDKKSILKHVHHTSNNAIIEDYEYSLGFNKTTKAHLLVMPFTQTLKVEITF